MIKKIEFENMYSFRERFILDFTSPTNIYTFIGANSFGKSSILDIIENINHSLWDFPNYSQLRKVVNRNTNNPIIDISTMFTINNINYTYNLIVDTKSETFMLQQLLYTDCGSHIINYQNGILSSDYFSENQIETFNTFDIKHNGLLPYVNNFCSTNKIGEIKAIIKSAQNQDFLVLDIETLQNDQSFYNYTLNLLQELDSDITAFKILNHQKKTTVQLQAVSGERKGRFIDQIGPRLEVTIVHNNFELPLQEESAGINTIFNLCLEMFSYRGDDYFQPRLIDDFGCNLHDDFFKHLLTIYQQHAKRQLIFTTNKGVILSQKLLPKESIFIVDKASNESSISCLSEFKWLRPDARHNWFKIYTQGKLGGKPNITKEN